ncbi:hypothetical protein Slash_89 [Bacillus phage Slash]|uniref:Uncharacterized protein n=3 Tax=Slashvirus TaxID=1921709 RepID=U5PYA2_9CAUD|nr:hypothetical protein Staley_93 [Bacillus phage Staley]YP_008771991.1 hypothetical protein Slash_89 [Bacillus phage Slash]YP_009203694.1 hypothetical protein CPT_Stahl90 [Bacillus phage Stahl]AGY48378.1 hypothetical protein Slash_89 [Bacillus phage Slash]AGY48776.1 hypothetical protein Staley_93 [Bacillus phage Staley]AKA61518.1 hypothetical protein CPT_Stahl90 [Bacillus phage Stahl]
MKKNAVSDELCGLLDGENEETLREICSVITYYYGYRSGQCSGSKKFSQIIAEIQEEILEKVK